MSLEEIPGFFYSSFKIYSLGSKQQPLSLGSFDRINHRK